MDTVAVQADYWWKVLIALAVCLGILLAVAWLIRIYWMNGSLQRLRGKIQGPVALVQRKNHGLHAQTVMLRLGDQEGFLVYQTREHCCLLWQGEIDEQGFPLKEELEVKLNQKRSKK